MLKKTIYLLIVTEGDQSAMTAFTNIPRVSTEGGGPDAELAN